MMKRDVFLVAVLFVLGLLASAQSQIQGADKDKKTPDALETVKAFLNFAFTGQFEAAAKLGAPDKSYNRQEKIKEFEKIEAKNPPAIVRFLADDEHALAITEAVVTKDKKQGGPLEIELVKKDNHWLVRDVDLSGKDHADKNLKRFQRRFPKAKVVIPKNEK